MSQPTPCWVLGHGLRMLVPIAYSTCTDLGDQHTRTHTHRCVMQPTHALVPKQGVSCLARGQSDYSRPALPKRDEKECLGSNHSTIRAHKTTHVVSQVNLVISRRFHAGGPTGRRYPYAQQRYLLCTAALTLYDDTTGARCVQQRSEPLSFLVYRFVCM